MLLQFILIILINTIVVIASDDESEESKYIDLLPEKEKKEFIEKIARRILAEVTSTEVHKNKSEELTDSQLNTHSAYVARLLKEESDNLRRRIAHENEKKAATINDAIPKDTSPSSNDFYENSLHKVNKPENQNLTKVIEKTVNVLLDEHNNITTTTENLKTGKEKDAKEQQKQNFGDLEKGTNSMKDQENKTEDLSLKKVSRDKNQQASINQNDRTDDRGSIDLTLRQKESTYLFSEPTTGKNEIQTSDSQISNAVENKKETISIEIEITDKKDALKSGSQIPVKVIYDYGTESKNSVTQSAVEISTSKNNNLEIQTSKNPNESVAKLQKISRRFSLDTQNKTIHHPDSQANKNGEQNILDSEQKKINNIFVNESVKNNSTFGQADNQHDTETTLRNDEKLEFNSTITIKPEVLQKIMQEALNQETDLENLSKSDDSKSNPNNVQVLSEYKALEDNLKTIQETVPQDLDIKQKSENEILRKKRTSSIQDTSTETSSISAKEEIEKITDESTISETTTTATMTQQESSTPPSTTFATFTAATKSTAITDTKESTTIDDTKESATIAATRKQFATTATTSDSITTKNASDTTTSEVTSTRNIEEESPTKIILLESGSNEYVTNDNSPTNETTTEEIVKARTVFITGYPDEGTDDETEATPYSIVTEADTDEDSDMDIKELSNSSDISPTTTTEVTESPITTLVIDSVTNNASVNDKEVAIEKVLRNSKGELFTSTQITPLTTKAFEEETIEKNKRFFYSEEIVVKNDSVVNHVENKTIKTIKNIVDTISQNALRQDSNQVDRHDKNNGNKKVQRKEYVVFELLPGQNPFQQEKRPSGKDPRQYPKLPKENPRSALKSKTNNPSQIDHPNYAVVYNYDPKYAYYNPNNRYGPEGEKDDASINAILNDKNSQSYAVENDNKDLSNSFSSKENWSSRHNEKVRLRSDEPSAPHSDKIDLDYYFGDGDKNFLRKGISIGCKVIINNDDESEGGLKVANIKNCPSSEKVVYLDPNVPPNSDDDEDIYNSLPNQGPSNSNYHQTKNILSLLGYSGYHAQEHDMNVTFKPYTGYAPGYTTLYTPPLDLLYSRLRKEDKVKKQLRSSQTDPQQKNYKVFNRYHTFIDEDPKQSKNNKYRVSSYSGNLNERKPKANGNNFDQSNKFQHPLIILTGNAGRNDQDAKIKTGRFIPLDYFYQDLFAEPEQDNEDHTKLMQKFGELYYDDADDTGKHRTLDREKKKKEYKSFDHVDSYSAKTKQLKKYPNIDAVKVKTPVKKITKSLLEQLEAIYNKGKTFKVNKKADKKYDKRHEQLEASLNVLKDMIAQENNKALQKYNWLVTAVDIRSALTKLQNLSVTTRHESIHPGHDFVHPKDLQLLKYVLYLYIRAISPTEEEVIREKSNNYPKNMRFLEDQDPISPSKRRSLNFLSSKPSDDVPRNMRFLEPEGGNLNNKARAVEDKPWTSTKGMIPKLLGLEKFLKSIEIALNELHDAIRHIAEITNYRSQRWYTNMKELYLENPTRKILLELLLHLTFTRALDIINGGLKHGLQDNHVKFALAYPEEVTQAVEEFQLAVDILNEIEGINTS